MSTKEEEHFPIMALIAARAAYSPAEAADLIGVTRATIYNLMNRGQLRSVKIGRCRRIPASAINALIEGGAADA